VLLRLGGFRAGGPLFSRRLRRLNEPAPTGRRPAGPTLTSVRVHYSGPSVRRRCNVAARLDPPAVVGQERHTHGRETRPLYVVHAGCEDEIELKPLLGDAWSRGPNYKVKPGQSIDVYPTSSRATAGHEQYPSFVSQKLPSTRGIWVYLPPTYVENTEGASVSSTCTMDNLRRHNSRSAANEWKVDETMDRAPRRSIRETIVIASEGRRTGLRSSRDRGPARWRRPRRRLHRMLIDEIKPMIDKDLRTIPAASNRDHGLVVGGLVSAYAGVRRADVFGLVGEMSPSTWWQAHDPRECRPPDPIWKPLRVYVDSGDSGTSNDDVVNTTELAARYRKVGYTDSKICSMSSSRVGSTAKCTGRSVFRQRSTSCSALAGLSACSSSARWLHALAALRCGGERTQSLADRDRCFDRDRRRARRMR